MGDHAETVQIDFDPATITYGELLEVFGRTHDPTHRSWSRQYASLILYHSGEQQRLAEAWKAREARTRNRPIATGIIAFSGFTLAEEYHQKHALQRFPELLEELRSVYPTVPELIGSTAATRINGHVAGDGNCEALLEEIDTFGLSKRGQQRLREVVCGPSASSGDACPVPGAR